MIKITTVIVLIISLIGCVNNNKRDNVLTNKQQKIYHTNDSLNAIIMQIHDDAMKYNSYILQLKRKVNDKADSVPQKNIKDSLIAVSALLHIADKKMLDWMHSYQKPDMQQDTSYIYLVKQKQLMETIHTITFDAIKKAENLLK